MKTKGFIAALLMFVALTVTAQTPQNIQDAFKSKYPDAAVKKIRHQMGNYIVVFAKDGEKYNAVFSRDGNWMRTITHRKWKEMPGPVRIALHRSIYSDWQVNECNQVETPNGTLYSFEVDNEYTLSGDEQPAFAEDCYVYFTPTGSMVNQVK
jgi:hypothetical protein